MPVEHSAGHLLIVGTTGAGKTRLLDLLVTQAVLRGEAVVILDPKGDRDLQLVGATCLCAPARPVRQLPSGLSGSQSSARSAL
ncbi:MAG: type IV secretion system DNA-binding domain-containing protein [Chromatiales bacterium]|nr:type IV secretion system DNA-binding domain-containing protein [Chromatiales bacterium]